MRILAVAVILATSSASAETLPGFDLEGAAWNATSIVVAAPKDGAYRVTGTWFGTATPGDKLALSPKPPADHAAARVVVFLRGTGPASEWGGIDTAVVWLDGGKAFAVVPDELVVRADRIGDLRLDEAKLHALVDDVLADRAALQRASHLADPRVRAAQLRPIAESKRFRARRDALTALAATGADAVPVLHALLADDRRDPGGVVEALAQAATDKPGELLAIVREEIELWRIALPKLREGWWNDGRADTERLRNHYGKLLAALQQLQPLRVASARAPVTALRDFWRSTPVLEDPSGLDQMSQTADAVLLGLRVAPTK